MITKNPLLEKLFYNPYRILGLYGGVSDRIIRNQKDKLEAYIRIGQNPKLENDFSLLPFIERNETNITEAVKSINRNEERFFNCLFWVVKLNSIDEDAIKYLEKGNYEEALDIWSAAVKKADWLTEELSWYNNLSTLQLIIAVISKDECLFKNCMDLKLKMLHKFTIMEFSTILTDKTYKYKEKIITDMVLEISDSYATEFFYKGIEQIVDLTDEKKYSQFVTDWYSNKLVVKIEECIDRVHDVGRSDVKGYKTAADLMKNCIRVLAELEELLDKNSHSFQKLSAKITETLYLIIEKEIKELVIKANKSPVDSFKSAFSFVICCEELLPCIEDLLGDDYLEFKNTCDNIALVLNKISIEYGNHLYESSVVGSIHFKEEDFYLLDYANKVAKSERIINLIENNVSYLLDNINSVRSARGYRKLLPSIAFKASAKQVRPWVRFWARFIDILLLVVCIRFFLGLYNVSVNYSDLLILIIISIFVFVFIEAYLLSSWGMTPGKFLLRVIIRKAYGNRLWFKEALTRSFRVFVRAESLGLPFVIITLILAYNRLVTKGIASWDEETYLYQRTCNEIAEGVRVFSISFHDMCFDNYCGEERKEGIRKAIELLNTVKPFIKDVQLNNRVIEDIKILERNMTYFVI